MKYAQKIMASLLSVCMFLNAGITDVFAYENTSDTTTQTSEDTSQSQSDVLESSNQSSSYSQQETSQTTNTNEAEETASLYVWQNLEDQQLYDWMGSADNAEYIYNLLTQSNEEYYALMDRIDEIADESLLEAVYSKLEEITQNKDDAQELDGEQQEITVASEADTTFLDEPAFQSMYEELFGEGAVATEENIVYVAGETALSGTGETHITEGKYGNPYLSLIKAYQNTNGTGNTIIYLQSDYKVSSISTEKTWKGYTEDEDLKTSGWPTYSHPVIIVSDAGVYIPMYGNIYFSGNVGFYRTGIEVKYDEGVNKQIYCNGHKIIFGGQGQNNFTVKSDTGYYPTLFGGSENTEIASTDLTVNGGTFARIFGAGFTGSTVTGTATTVIDGRVNDKNGDPIPGQCSVSIIDKGDLAKTAYAFSQNKNNYENISGGAVGNSETKGSKGTVGSTNLTIRYLNYKGTRAYYAAPNGGDITGNTSITVENSNLIRIQRGPGEVDGDWDFIVKDESTTVVDVHHLYNYNTGIVEGADMRVECSDSTIPEFYGKYDSGGVNDGGKGQDTRESHYAINLSYTFVNCSLGTKGNFFRFDQPNYKNDDLNVDITIDGCKFVNGARVGCVIRSKLISFTFKNMTQTILFGTYENSDEQTDENQVVFYGDGRKASVALEKAKMIVAAEQQIVITSLTLNTGGEFSTDTITIPSFSGHGGQVNVSDKSTVTFSSVDPDTDCTFGAYGPISDRCTIVGGVNAFDANVNQFKNGQDVYHYYKYGGKATSVWILSEKVIEFDPNKCIYVDQKGGTDPVNLSNIDNPTAYGTMGEPVKSLKAAYLLVTEERNKIVFVSGYTTNAGEELAEVDDKNIPVTWCAFDGLTDYQDAGIVYIKADYDLLKADCHLPSDTTLEHIKLIGIEQDPEEKKNHGNKDIYNNLYADGHTVVVEESVTVSNISLYGDGGAETAVNQVNLIVKGGNWKNVGMNGGLIGNADGLNLDNTKDKDTVSITFDYDAKVDKGLYLDGTVYGNTKVDFSGNSTTNTFTSAGTYYGNVDITVWQNGTGEFDTIDGTYYGSLTYNHTVKAGTLRDMRIYGHYYKNSTITYDATCQNELTNMTIGIAEVDNQASVSINYEEGSLIDKLYLQSNQYQQLGGNGTVDVNMAGTVLYVTSNAKEKPASGYNVTLSGNEANGKAFTLKDLYGWDKVTVDEDTSVTIDDTSVTANGLYLKQNALLLSPKSTTLSTDEKNNGSLFLASGSELRCLDVLTIYGSASGDGGQLTLNHKPSTPSVITGDVTGQIYMDSAYHYTTESDGTEKGEFLKTGPNTTLTNLLVREFTDDGFKYKISEYTKDNDEITWRFGRIQDHSVVYLKDDGNDELNGLHVDTAVKTLYRAFELVEPGGTIVICGNTTVTEWPSNDYKDITYTSYDKYADPENPVDYSDNSNAVTFTVPEQVFIHSNTVFESINVYGLKDFCANGYAVTFGVESTKQAEGQTNFRSEHRLRVAGSYWKYIRYPVSVTIHSGDFISVDPWCSNEKENGIENETVIEVTMTGGHVDELGVGVEEPWNNQHRDSPVGKAEYNLSGGTVDKLGYSKGIGYGVTSVKYTETYNITGSFRFNEFYAGYTETRNGTMVLNISGTGTSEDDAFPMLCYGNSDDGARTNPLIVNLTNARIKLVKGGNSTQKYTGGDVIFNLHEDGIIDEFYCGSSTTMGNNVKRVEVNLLAATASVGKLYSHGYNTDLRPDEIQVTIAKGINEKVDDFDFIDTSVDILQVGASITSTESNQTVDYLGYVGLERSLNGKFDSLKILAESKADIGRGVSFTGNYEGEKKGEHTAIICLPDAGNLSFDGSVSGVTEIQGINANETFPNGFVVSAASGVEDNFIYQSESESKQLYFSKGTTSCVWKVLPDGGASSNVVYVSGSNGVDQNGTQGSQADPVQTLAYAYKLAESRYADLVAQSQNESLSDDDKQKIQEDLTNGINIIVLDSIELGDFSAIAADANAKVTVQGLGENGTSQIIFNDSNYTYLTPVETTIRNITLKDTTTQDSYVPSIYAEGNKLTIEETVYCSSDIERLDFVIYGGSDSSSVASTELDIQGGTWNQIFGGSFMQSVTGQAKITLGNKVKVVTTNDGQADYGAVFGGGKFASATVGSVLITINDGDLYQVYGGGSVAAVNGNVEIQFLNGKIGSLYGGGLDTGASVQNAAITIGTSGNTAEITKSVRGGGQRGSANEATITLNAGTVIDEDVTFCAGGYAGTVGTVNLNIKSGAQVNSDIYGGGYGIDSDESCGNVTSAVYVTVNGGTITKTLYGGGNNGLVKGTVNVSVNSGSILGNVYGGGNAAGVIYSQVDLNAGSIEGNVFGGSYNIERDERQIQKTSQVNVGNTTVSGAVFGGSDTSGTISEGVSVNITGNAAIVDNGVFGGGSKASLTVAPNVTVAAGAGLTGDIYGGGQGEEKTSAAAKVKRVLSTVLAAVSGSDFSISGLNDANVPSTSVTINGTVNGNIYGGGKLATVGSEDSDTWTNTVTNVTVNENAVINGNVYGGGEGKNGEDYALIYGNTSVELNGGKIQAKNEAGEITDSEDETNGAVFGGGKIAPVAGSTNVSVNGGTISNIFGGNDLSGIVKQGAKVEVTADSTANITHLYGGGRNADIEKASVSISDGSIKEVYGGGNEATVTESASITVQTDDDQHIDTLYAGNNAATMSIKPDLKLTSGKIGTVFCGGNAGIMNVSGLSYDFDYQNIVVGELYAGCNNTEEATSDVTLNLISGKYGTVYGANNKNGYMEQTNIQISEFESDKLFVDTIYGGGNQAESLNTKVVLNSYSSKKKEQSSQEETSSTESPQENTPADTNQPEEGDQSNIDQPEEGEQSNTAKPEEITGQLSIYGGGNEANVQKAEIELINGYAYEVYGGGNAATVTNSTTISSPDNGTAVIENMYCGNNQADMSIHPTIQLQAVEIESFYGGGNAGAMLQNLEYTFDQKATQIDTIYGGCNQANVEGNVTLNLSGATLKTIYGGCNTSGYVYNTLINVNGDADTIFGGGCGENTSVDAATVLVKEGTISNNVYGGSGYGSVTSTKVTVSDTNGRIDIKGNVFGAGYGETSVAQNTEVLIDMNLKIATSAATVDYDLLVTEGSDDYEDNDEEPSGETKANMQWAQGKAETVSTIEGSVYGGADMGQVGSGFINTGNNTAEISTAGQTVVRLTNGYIQGNLFGGGNGTPSDGNTYSVYMGTVFGSSNTTVTGGFVNGSIFGCGNQARSFADAEQNAATLDITETAGTPIVIGTSVFAGGMRGDGTTFNATVYTVVGDVEVNITGIGPTGDLVSEPNPTRIYFLSDNYGGVYGDGNLCLVNGKRTVNMTNFNFGKDYGDLKTFYSLQRADEVNLRNTRIVLEGAEDLVDADSSMTKYSINRVSQLNMYDNSAIKLTTVVNYLGGLWSDQDTDTIFIDNGNNGTNGYTKRNGNLEKTVITEEMEDEYRKDYDELVKKNKVSSTYQSMNVVAVANGEYLEIKKLDGSYGNVTGLFTLQLLHANQGEGGGFVYANIGNNNDGTTGDFICVTRLHSDETKFMDVIDSVGGYRESDYTYYYWYLKGDAYNYKVNLNGYIGTTETEFSETVLLPTEISTNGNGYFYVLNSVGGDNLVEDLASSSAFSTERFVDHWDESFNTQDKYAIEIVAHTVVKKGDERVVENDSIGYLSYDQTEKKWYIKKDDTTLLSGLTETDAPMTDVFQKEIKDNIVLEVDPNTEYIRLELILHKGNGVDVELKNVMNQFSFALKMLDDNYGKYVDVNDSSTINVTTQTTITRIVPTQDVYVSSGRQYAGVGSDSPAKITGKSAFTVQYITRYIPSVFNANGDISEYLDLTCTQKYLLSSDGIGFTVQENDEGKFEKLVSVTSGTLSDYDGKLNQDADGNYIYTKTVEDEDGLSSYQTDILTCENTVQSTSALPAGTTITLLASIDDETPTYWYYYCKEATSKISLSDFVRMNQNQDSSDHYSLEAASRNTVSGNTSTRIIENLIFVIDFVSTDIDENLVGNLQLKHEYKLSANESKDIMDYVQEKTDENDDISYVRSYPHVSSAFEINPNADAIQGFSLTLLDDDVYENGVLSAQISITPNTEYLNTRYDERQYSATLTLMEKDENGEWKQVAFPQGAVFTSNGKILKAAEENKTVAVPASTATDSVVTIDTHLDGFEEGKQYKLNAVLYSAPDASYYNDLSTTHEASVEFVVKKNVAHSIKVSSNTDSSAWRVLKQTGSFAGTIQVKDESAEGNYNKVSVNLYKQSGNAFSSVAMATVFENAEITGSNFTWSVSEYAPQGVYRLEFIYFDKAEYLDVIVK
jgi:hypothetical protein